MNKQRMLDLAEHIKGLEPFINSEAGVDRFENSDKGDKFFQLATWISKPTGKKPNECGTAGCIAGWACVLNDRVDVNTSTYKKLMDSDYFETARKWLGLTEIQAEELFLPRYIRNKLDIAWNDIKPRQAAEVVELVAHGIEVNDAWKIVIRDLPRPDIASKTNEEKELEQLGQDINRLSLQTKQEVTT